LEHVNETQGSDEIISCSFGRVRQLRTFTSYSDSIFMCMESVSLL